jgi:transketolase
MPKNDRFQLDLATKQSLFQVAQTIRHLSMDAVERAGSGHPGLPLGCAEIGAYLYGIYLRHNPHNPNWINRDRFILSAGHGVLLQYIGLHLSGFDLSIDDLKNYRKCGSKTPSHPQLNVTQGIETTTGADGHGVGNAVGTALGLKILAHKFSDHNYPLIDSKVVVLAGDGCMMEGISSEACALAGHFLLNNLILIYDSNSTCLDGYVNEVSSENTYIRYKAYGWDVIEIDGHDLDQIHESLHPTRFTQTKPLLIIAKTTIGKGSPHKEGTPDAHGEPLGASEIKEAKKKLNLPDQDFYVDLSIYDFFEKRKEKMLETEQTWNVLFQKWAYNNQDQKKIWAGMQTLPSVSELEALLKNCYNEADLPTRFASHDIINCLASQLPQIYGGSADLAKSDGTFLVDYPVVLPPKYCGRNIKYGVREFAMGAIAIGLSQTGFIIPFVGTFLSFSDYMRHSIRMAALMRTQVIFHFTHDSIFVGEDGPTHQPVEHIASLRAIPNLQVIRPADYNEVKSAWIAALQWNGPTALILSRQPLPELKETRVPFHKGAGKGAYIIKKEQGKALDYTFFATGSEVHLALSVSQALEDQGMQTMVISIPSWEIFEKQSQEYKNELLVGNFGIRVSLEAGVKQGWEKYIGRQGISISVEEFGSSGSIECLKDKFGFTVSSVVDLLTQRRMQNAQYQLL